MHIQFNLTEQEMAYYNTALSKVFSAYPGEQHNPKSWWDDELEHQETSRHPPAGQPQSLAGHEAT